MSAQLKMVSYCTAALFQERSAVMPLRIRACHVSGWCHRTSSARSTAFSIAPVSGGENVQPVPFFGSSVNYNTTDEMTSTLSILGLL